MKLDKFSLKWKLFLYILLFAIIVILVFCVFEILLLDPFYRSIKKNRTENLLTTINEVVDEQTFNSLMSDTTSIHSKIVELANENEATIFFVDKDDNINGESIITINIKGSSTSGGLAKFNRQTLVLKFKDVWTLAENAGYKTNGSQFFIVLTDNPDPRFQLQVLNNDQQANNDSIICGQFIQESTNSYYLLVVDSRLTPVTPAVQTLKMQLVFIAFIILILTILMALWLSKNISRPIVKMNDSAKKLALGQYDISFDGKGYLEIAELNDTLNYAVAELKKTETLQRELLANVSHDLRTPLTLISGYAELIRDIPSENNPENIQLIIDEASRLSVLVSDLLNLSRINSRTEPLNLQTYNITKNILAIVDRQAKLLETKGFKIEFIYDQEVYVKADITKIEQVIYNFINNAVNYSGTSKKVEVIQEVNNNYVTIKIKDYGIGIKKENLAYIWDRYYRVDKGHQRSIQGSGLGLSIIKGILEYHDFKYGVESTEGIGSIFFFTIPIENDKI